MQFIDTHIHLQDDKSSNATDIILRAQYCGCTQMVCVSSRPSDWKQVASLSEQFPSVIIPAFGLHPWYISEAEGCWLTDLENLLRQYPQALVGECGLDGFHPDMSRQKEIFAHHISLARKYSRPLIVHAVKATQELEDFWNLLPEKFVFHGFNSKQQLLKKIIHAGGYIGLGKNILRHPKAQSLLELVPADRILFETDAPFQAQGSWDIVQQVNEMAFLRQEDALLLSAQVYRNSMTFLHTAKEFFDAADA